MLFLKEDTHGVEVLGLNATKAEIRQSHGKSDDVSKTYTVYAAFAKSINHTDWELFALTKAVFYAASPEQKAVTYAIRCQRLQELGIFDGSIEDAKRALEVKFHRH
ncbi:unnamed protein product [Rodentolepis nana]|uniref:Tetratricopeptide repeat protein n=1 Tax=Rodentolepis nana TaxID=102285 RepID=A0A0R3TGY3_RODNA|nr:unnamed protein product [Rodentolepis nana]